MGQSWKSTLLIWLKFDVTLIQQGSYLFTMYRPVEQLQQLLIQSQGFDSDSVHAFFKCYKVSLHK